MFDRLTLEGGFNTKTKLVQARFEHDDLFGFMLFQFGLSLIEGRQFRQCGFCGQWFRLAPSTARADKATCSDSCRYQLYRRRRRRAIQLHDEGRTAKQISKALGSDVSTIKKWLQERNDQHGTKTTRAQ
jgi:hypothetical protein